MCQTVSRQHDKPLVTSANVNSTIYSGLAMINISKIFPASATDLLAGARISYRDVSENRYPEFRATD